MGPKTERVINGGWLVIDDLHERGCTSYRQHDREEELKGRRLEGEWRTEKEVIDVDEQAEVSTTARRIRATIRKLGYQTLAGTFVPEEKGDELNDAIRDADVAIRQYNADANYTRIDGRFLVFRIEPSDVRAAGSILGQVRDTLEEVKRAVDAADPKAIRRALGSVRRIDTMLADEQSEQLQAAFDDARRAARQLTKAAKEQDDELKELASEVEAVDTARILFAEVEKQVNKMQYDVPVVDYRNVEIEEDEDEEDAG